MLALVELLYVPAVHSIHALPPVVGMYVDGTQDEHVVEPEALVAEPGKHMEHWDTPTVLEKDPTPQNAGAADPDTQNCPA